MAKNNNLTDFLTDIADAIRTKKGTEDPINAQDFASEIQSITAGGDSGSIDDNFDETQFHKITAIYVTDEMNYYDEHYEIHVINSYATVDRMFVNGVEVEEPECYYYVKDPGTYTFELWIPIENWQDELSSLFIGADPVIVILPNSINEIPARSFIDLQYLKTVIIPNSVTSIGDGAFRACSELESATIPNSVTSIGHEAFWSCDKLNVYIPNSVTSIGDGAFGINIGDHEIILNIPNSVTSIGHNAFSFRNIQEVNIPESVTSIGVNAFYKCRKLESVYCKAVTPPTGGTGMFDNNASNRKIYVPTGSVDAYKAANGWSDYADAIEGHNF